MTAFEKTKEVEKAAYEYLKKTVGKQYCMDYRKCLARVISRRYGVKSDFFVDMMCHNNTYGSDIIRNEI